MRSATVLKRIARPLCEPQLSLRSQRYQIISFRTKFRSSCPSSTRHQSSHHAPRRAPLQSSARNGIAFFAVALISSIAGYQYFASSEEQILNDTIFIPYRISSRETISSTSFVITLSPITTNLTASSKPYIDSETGKWKFPLWSVEFKQPEVQIARHYTPLPATDEDGLRAELKFYIRTVGDGEMSNYLGRLREGEEVFMRGPHRGFDVLNRLGSERNLVVLAGGTGVVPGLQAAEAVLSAHQDAKVKILWAVRKREELQIAEPPQRGWFAKPAPTEVEGDIASPSPVGKQLVYMKEKYGDRFSLQLSVDEEGSFFSSQNISKALASTTSSPTSTASPTPHDCQLHSQNLHMGVSEFENNPPDCSLGADASSSAGKNLLLVSGPEGFVGHFAGAKRWAQGTQVQGPVGGLIGRIQAQDPKRKDDWLVLKL